MRREGNKAEGHWFHTPFKKRVQGFVSAVGLAHAESKQSQRELLKKLAPEVRLGSTSGGGKPPARRRAHTGSGVAQSRIQVTRGYAERDREALCL